MILFKKKNNSIFNYLSRKLRQLTDQKILNKFKKIYPKSYLYLKQLKNKIKL